MRLIDRWVLPWMDRSWRMLIMWQFMLASMVACLAGLWVLLPEQRAMQDLRHSIDRQENVLAEHRRAWTELPSPDRLASDIASLDRELAHCAAQHDQPGQFIGSIDPGRSGRLTWRSVQPSGDAPAAGRWAVTVITDYRGLQRVLQGLTVLSGCWPLTSFEVVTHGERLHVAFSLGMPDEELKRDE